MKNSIKSGSYKRTIGGLIFFHGKDVRPKEKVYPSVHAWVTAGHPDNCYVYDCVDALAASRIPVKDAVYFNGIWVRQKKIMPLKQANVRIDGRIVKPVIPARPERKVDRIALADTKDHHKMAYG